MRVTLCSESEMSPAELRALWTLQRTGRLRFERSEAEKRDAVRDCAADFIAVPPASRDVYTWVFVRRRLARLEPAFAALRFDSAIAGLGRHPKPGAMGTAARWSCAVGAFRDRDFGTAKERFRDALPKRRNRSRSGERRPAV